MQKDGTWLVLVAVTVFLAAMYGFLVLTRLRYPFAIDWMEDGGMYESREIAQGHPLFPTGGGTFVPFAYPPVYYALVAAVSRATGGVTFAVGRGVSNAAFVSSIVLAALHVRRVLAQRLHFEQAHANAIAASVVALAACAVLAARGAFDLARVDTLGGAFLLGAFIVGAKIVSDERYQRPLFPFAVAVLMTLAVYTKQLHLASAVAMALLLGRAHKKSGIVYAVALAALCVGSFVLLQSSSHGGFARFVFGLRNHAVQPERALTGLSILFVGSIQLPLGLGTGVLRFRHMSPGTRFWILSTLAAIPGALLAYAKIWGETNNFLPLLMLAPVSFVLVLSETAAQRVTSVRPERAIAALLAMFLLGKVTEQDPFRATPSAQERAQHLVDEVARLDGDVVCPIYPFLPVLAGHTEPQTALLSMLDSEAAHIPNVTGAAYVDGLRARRPRYFLLTGHEAERLLAPMLASEYHFVRKLPGPYTGDVVGVFNVPDLLYERNAPH